MDDLHKTTKLKLLGKNHMVSNLDNWALNSGSLTSVTVGFIFIT